MADKNKQKKPVNSNSQVGQTDGWNVVSQKKQNDKENSQVSNIGKESAVVSNIIKSNGSINQAQKNINQSLDSGCGDDKCEDNKINGNQLENKKSVDENNDTNSVGSRSEETNNQLQITPTDKFNQFRERLNEQTKRYYYFDRQFFKIYNCQQINGLDSNQIIKLKDESSQIFQDLRNIILSYINYNGGIIFFGFNHIKKENSPHMEVHGFDITKNDHKKYDQLQKTLEIITSRITPSKIKYDLSIMKVRKDKNQDRFTQEKYVARIIVQQGQDLRTLYIYKEPNSNEQISAKYSKKDFKFITIKGSGLTLAAEQKKQLTKVKDLIFTHIDDFIDPQSSYVNIKNSKAKYQDDYKKAQEDELNDSFNNSNKSNDESFHEKNSNSSENLYEDEYEQSESSNNYKNKYKDPSNQQYVKKETSRKASELNQNIPKSKEQNESTKYNSQLGQWGEEVTTEKQSIKVKDQNQDNSQNNQNLLSQKQEENSFQQIGSYGLKQPLQYTDQTDPQQNFSIHQQESYSLLGNGQQVNLEQQMYNNSINKIILQQNNQNLHKIIQPNSIDSQNKSQSNSASLTPDIMNQKAAVIYQNQQQMLLQNMYLNQVQSSNQIINNSNQLQNPGITNIFKPIDYNLQQQQTQYHQKTLNQHNVPMAPSYQYPIFSPPYLQYIPNQSTKHISSSNQPQTINNATNYESKLNNSLKSLSTHELEDLTLLLEEKLKCYQDYLQLVKQKIKEESLTFNKVVY